MDAIRGHRKDSYGDKCRTKRLNLGLFYIFTCIIISGNSLDKENVHGRRRS